MYLHFIFALLLNFALSEALFFWKEKSIFFCFKVCPLYCSKRQRRDVGMSSMMYSEDGPPSFSPEFWVDEYPDPPFPDGYWVYHKPRPTTPKPTTTTSTTTMAPTTTEEPTYICVVCEKKCANGEDVEWEHQFKKMTKDVVNAIYDSINLRKTT